MKLPLCILVLVLCSVVIGQAAQEPQTIEPTKPIEREISGGESHTYQINLTAGQFVRLRLDQRAIDGSLTLNAEDSKPSDNKRPIEMNLTGVGEEESLLFEAANSGSYRITVRGVGVATPRGSYCLEVLVHPTASSQDRKRLAAQALMLEAYELKKQEAKGAQQVVENSEKALAIFRELAEPVWIAYALFMTGEAYLDLDQPEKAIGFYEQTLAISRESNFRAREALAISALGKTCYQQRRYEKAIEYYEQALPIKRELKDRDGEGETLIGLGVTYLTLRRFEKVGSEHRLSIDERNRLFSS